MGCPAITSLAAFHGRLQRWYESHGRRDLPWRNTRDPYAIYISEVMLQQTQVETVRTRFYRPFLRRFPTLAALAEAAPEDVLSVWQGLGYYRRAGYLHAAAKQSKGHLPETVEELLALPGIGKNTAHAILAFAHHQPVAVMEANLKRVLCRIFAMPNPTAAELWEKAEQLLNRGAPFDYNQAMMDIGSMICTKRAPKCGECPANEICEGKKSPEAYPAAKSKKKVPVRTRTIVVSMDAKGRVAATPRATKFLHGLYHFTEQETPPPKHAVKLGDIRQSYSHFTLEASVYLLSFPRKRESSNFKELDARLHGHDKVKLYTLAELHTLPMSMAEKKILQLLAGYDKCLR